MEKIYDVIVLGGGIAGYSAALTLKSLKRSCLWLGSDLFGEKLRSAEYVRNYPAVLGGGKEFVARLRNCSMRAFYSRVAGQTPYMREKFIQ